MNVIDFGGEQTNWMFRAQPIPDDWLPGGNTGLGLKDQTNYREYQQEQVKSLVAAKGQKQSLFGDLE